MTAASTSGDARLAITAGIQAALSGGPPIAVATVVRSGAVDVEVGAKLAVTAGGDHIGGLGSDQIDALVQSGAVEALSARPREESLTLYVTADGATTRPSQAAPDAAQMMVQIYEAPARLLVVGGGHVGLALARIGAEVGFTIAVLDDREEFANAERFPMAEEVYNGDIAETLDNISIDARTYIVLVSRGHQQDETALRHTVGRGAAYVGMIGSRRRTGTVIDRLASGGFDGVDLDAVHTPIGLDIGAETPEEIALSILAQMVLVRRGGTGRAMRDARGRASNRGA